MNKFGFAVLFILMSCGGTLSDEQRKKLKEGMEQQKIVRVTDSEIMSATLDKAHQVYSSLERTGFNPAKIDSLEDEYRVNIKWVIPGSENALDIEKELIEAYILGITEGAKQENLQKLWTTQQKDDYDSLLYTRPKITRFADGSEQLDGLWNISLSRKEIVLEIGKDR